MFDIIVLIMSIVVNIIFIIIIVKFRDLIKFGLMFRKVLHELGYFNMNAEELSEKIRGWQKFAKPFLHSEDEEVPLPEHMQEPSGDLL